ncbi:MAG: hypothetical protein GX589_04355, partial [Deltaproteobacteria bacterium]|nr:hypothetical protein [Deltaproteobacteria bacterium]
MNSYRLFLLPVLFLALISMEAFAQDSTGLQTRLENCHQRLESLYAAGAPAQQIDSARRCVSRLHKRLIKSGQGQMLWVRQRVQAALDGAADGTMAWELEPRAAVRAKTPSRKQMNKIVREFLGSSFEGESCIKNCAQIRGNMKSGTQKCKGGGTVTVKVSRCSPNGNVAFWL